MRVLSVVFVFCILVTASHGQNSPSITKKSIKATVVAENVGNRFLACWHVCSLRLIVRIDGRTSEYAIVSVIFMDDRHLKEKGSHWKLVEATKQWKFKVVPDNPSFVELKQFATVINMETREELSQKVQMKEWLLLKVSENLQLPFGQTIASYSVDIGEFKSIK